MTEKENIKRLFAHLGFPVSWVLFPQFLALRHAALSERVGRISDAPCKQRQLGSLCRSYISDLLLFSFLFERSGSVESS